MKIFQFIEQYCQDLVSEYKAKRSLVDLSEFPHDGIVEDIEGNRIPVVYIEGQSVPISDFLTMDKADFCDTWRLQTAGDTYSEYIGLLEILEGEEAVNRIRNSMLAEKERLSVDVEMITSV